MTRMRYFCMVLLCFAIASLTPTASAAERTQDSPNWNWFLVIPNSNPDFYSYHRMMIFRLGPAIVDREGNAVRVDFLEPKLPGSRMRFTGEFTSVESIRGVLKGVDLDGERELPMIGRYRKSVVSVRGQNCPQQEILLQNDGGDSGRLLDGTVLVLVPHQTGSCKVW